MLYHKHKTVFNLLSDVCLSLFFLYLFLLGIELLSCSLKGFGTGFARTLISTTSNPFTALFIGMLATAIIQSSSVTTSITVGFVAAGTLTVSNAVPIIMGANIGTTITCVIASFGHFSVEKEFSKAFPAAIVHDIFNILSVAVFLPIEIFFHPIERLSVFLTAFLLGRGGVTFQSPLDNIIDPISKRILSLFGEHYLILAFVSIILVVIAITFFVKILRRASAEKFESLIDRYLFKNALTAGLLGLCLTAFVQSSSITTSLVVTLVGTQLTTIEKVFPYTLGANLGTTVTAILAALVTGNVNAITVALCHSIFNAFGITVWYPLRKIPISMAKKLGTLSGKKRLLAFIYIVAIFIITPVIAIFVIGR
ncbi:Na/Pi symporter [candidate division WOR-3 bacterium]|nr:Na/Pi symporter [candidate division WOR-3 bacterium]